LARLQASTFEFRLLAAAQREGEPWYELEYVQQICR
jgi:hypothetical protein